MPLWIWFSSNSAQCNAAEIECANKKFIYITFYFSEVRLSCWTNLVEEQRDAQLADAERIVGGLFESSSDKTTNSLCSTISMATPEVAFISILRYGMLALELLPEKSSAGNVHTSLKFAILKR